MPGYQTSLRTAPFCLWVGACLAIGSPAALAKNYNYQNSTFNQQSALGNGAANYNNGSDDSKSEGVTNAMRALNRLSDLDIGGAIHYGYRGYGNYINSQKMDDLNTRADQLKGSLSSVGSANAAGSSQASSPKKLQDMDTGFLYRGETADVAAEFEKRSGMNRLEFFNQLAAAEASGLTWDDPDLMNKLEQRYQSFITKIPNKDFRDNIEKAHGMMDLAKKFNFLSAAADFYKKNRWGGEDPNAAAPKVAALGPADANPVPVVAAPENDGRAPASESAPPAPAAAMAKAAEPAGMYLGLEGTHGNELQDILNAADGDSIFSIVNKRYRKLTPLMAGKAVVQVAK